jgi:hypothetical protein
MLVYARLSIDKNFKKFRDVTYSEHVEFIITEMHRYRFTANVFVSFFVKCKRCEEVSIIFYY